MRIGGEAGKATVSNLSVSVKLYSYCGSDSIKTGGYYILKKGVASDGTYVR